MKPTLPPGMRGALLLNGDPETKKDELVSFILKMFGDPNFWPITDNERITVLKDIWGRARKIRDTEEA